MIKIGYQGILNSNSEEVAKQFASSLSEECLLLPLVSSFNVLDNVNNGNIDYGVVALGESKVQEIRRKYENVKDGVEWHLIGHLQTNKVKYIIDKVDIIHSVDSLRLAEEISKRATQHGKVIKVLVQVDAADEEAKFGMKKNEVENLVVEISKLPNVIVNGLMFIAPYVDNSENIRKYFVDMKEIFDEIKYNSNSENIQMEHLSMGMTNDFEIAIEEGATLIRVGTGIYGKRDYT